MPLLDCAVLLKEAKASKMKILAEAFVKHAIPLIDASRVQEAFLEQIKLTSKPELVIFSYKTTEITVEGNTIAEGSLSGRTVASMAYEFCDKLPCGTPIGKAMSGFAACELLGMVLGPNIHVSKRFKCRNEDHPQWLGYTSEIVAQFQERPVKRSASALAWWPEAFLKELMPQKKEIVWTRGADGMMRCPNGGINLEDARTNMLWQTGLPPECVPGNLTNPIGPPPPLERVGATAGEEPVISGLARRLFSMPRSTAPGATASTVELPTMARPFLPLECLGAGLNPDERHDDTCTFCGEMETDCGGDHGDEMRDIGRMEERYERRGRHRTY